MTDNFVRTNSSKLYHCLFWFLIIFCVINVAFPVTTPGHCIWYGQCNQTGPDYQNCLYNGTALPLKREIPGLVHKWCPHLNASATCCDDSQLKSLDMYILIVRNFLRTCPSCMSNLMYHLCEVTCSPVQSDFMEVKKTAVNSKTNKTYIVEIDVYISESYMQGTYNSCKLVNISSTGQFALDVMCGRWCAKRCSAMRWFSFMGDVSSLIVPFQTNYLNQTEPVVNGFKPLNFTVAPPCSEPVDVL